MRWTDKDRQFVLFGASNDAAFVNASASAAGGLFGFGPSQGSSVLSFNNLGNLLLRHGPSWLGRCEVPSVACDLMLYHSSRWLG